MGRPRRAFLDRLLGPVVIRESSGCWERQGHRVNGWYTQIAVGGTRSTRQYAHRASYEHFVGRIPGGMTLDHLCRNPICINPAHLEVVTMAENTRRGQSFSAVNGRKTHCIHGHSLHDAYIIKRTGARRCRICNAIGVAKWREANAEYRRECDRSWYARTRSAAARQART